MGLSLPRRKAFTLVELLVVIGIIALLISILLPVLGSARESGNSAACLANQRTIAQGIAIYSAENNLLYPIGYAYLDADPVTGGPANGAFSSANTITWQSTIESLLEEGRSIEYFIENSDSEMWLCPSADFEQSLHYANNPILMPHLPFEKQNTPANIPLLDGTKETQAFGSDTAMLWDMHINIEASSASIPNYFGPLEGIVPSGINAGQLRRPNLPALRYRGRDGSDLLIKLFGPAAEAPALGLAGYLPVFYPPANTVSTGWVIPVTDFPGFTVGSFREQQNGLRFRHSGDKKANVAFADGSVISLGWEERVGDNEGYVNEFQIKMLQPRLPSGVTY